MITEPTPTEAQLPRTPFRLFGSGSPGERRRIADVLRSETVGGGLLLVATVLALVWANSPAGASYEALRDARFGPAALHLDLTLGEWAADGLLAVFFFVAGVELKREFVAGDLRDPRRAALPVCAAIGGMVVPALVYVALTAGGGPGALRGWAIPTATDIAFALAVLAVVSTHLPAALRTFLLTLAVVDDLLAIVVIAFFYTQDLAPGLLLLALVPLALFALLVQKRVRSPWLLLPLAVATWALVHASGVHATVGGVLLGFTVPVLRSASTREPDGEGGLAERFEHVWRPLSAGVAAPVFAFFAAGVAVGGIGGLTRSLSEPLALGIVAALVVGKTAGILGSTWLVQRFTHAELDQDLSWWDVLGLAVLGGIGFTVSLLVGELSFGHGSEQNELVKVGVLTGSLTAAVLGSVLLRMRNGVYRRIAKREAFGG